MIRAFDKKVIVHFLVYLQRCRADIWAAYSHGLQRDTQSMMEIKRIVKRTRDSLLFDFGFGEEDPSKSRCFIGKYSELVRTLTSFMLNDFFLTRCMKSELRVFVAQYLGIDCFGIDGRLPRNIFEVRPSEDSKLVPERFECLSHTPTFSYLTTS